MPIRPRDKNGLLLPLSGYKKVKAFHSGGYYWDPLPQCLMLQFLGDYLPPVEVSQDHGEPVGWFRRFVGQKEVLSGSTPLGSRAVPKEQLDQLNEALKALHLAADANDTQQQNKELIYQFRLPSPEKDPELYRLRGPLWNRRLEILWGCEKAQDTSLNPADAIALLKQDRFYNLKKWLCWLAVLLLAMLLLWGLF